MSARARPVPCPSTCAMPTIRARSRWATDAQSLGHGRGYQYAHDAPNAVAAQQYPPDELVGRDYYLPTAYGHDRDLQQRTRKLRGIIRDGP